MAKGILSGRPSGAPPVGQQTIQPTLNLVAVLNVARIRKTFLWTSALTNPTFKKIFRGGPYRVITAAIGLDPTQVTDELLVAYSSPTWQFGRPTHVVVQFTGRFDTAKVMKGLKALPPGTLGNTRALQVVGREALAVSAPGFLPFVLIAVKKNVFAFTSVHMAPNVARALPGFGDAAMAARLKARPRQALLWGAFGRFDSLVNALKLPKNLGALSHVTGGTFVVKIRKAAWQAQLRVALDSTQAADGLVTLIGLGQAAFAAGGTLSSPSLLVSLVRKVRVKQQRKTVVAELSLSKADARGVAALLLGMMR